MQTENKTNASSSWGGSRQGAGRPKTTAKSISLRVPEDVAETLDSLGRGKQAAFIIRAIRTYIAAGGE